MKKTKLKDILKYDYLSGLIISDDKSKLAYKKTNANEKENKYESNLCIYDVDKKEYYQVTDQKNASIYTFDKNNNLIYKAKSEDNEDIFNIIDNPGVGKKIFSIKKDVESIKWLKDDIFLIKAKDKKSQKEKDKEKENNYYKELNKLPFWLNGVGYLEDEKHAYYFYNENDDKLDFIIESNKKRDITGIALNKDLDKLIYIVGNEDDNGVMELRESLYLYDIEKDEEKLLIEKEFSYNHIDFIDDEIIFIATDMKKGGVNEDSFIYVSDLSGKYKKITDDNFDMSFGNSIATDARYGNMRNYEVCDDRLYFVVTEKEKSKLYSIDIKGDIKTEIDENVEDFAVKDGDIYYFTMSKDSLNELKRKGSSDTLIENKVKTKLGEIETFEFKSNGDTLKGFVLLPTNFKEDKKYPTLLSVHGGPKTDFSEIFHHEHQMFANDGYIVIYTNPHGSSGNGVKYSDIRGKYGDIDYEDLMTFVDTAIDKYPQIDKDKMGIYGGSYGGFMTNRTIGHTNRFAAACAQRSISNWTSFYGVSDIGYYFTPDQTDSDPWQSLDSLWNQSPIKYADKVKTPTLFIHSDEDYRCPLEQGLQMYNKLKLDGVDTKMFIFHEENHELSRSGKPKGRIKRLKEIKKWFDGYLKQ